ncbi:MAG: methyltransferase domain-containing protein [candidate division Zixibacteria bacterium]|nr:methyltransferase domain-containing protein [candidate division Zixibacteria bacterium]
MDFENVYEDDFRASEYARLEFPGTYYLAYRDLPEIISKHVNGTKALDFGCGAGRSTRFLKKLGFNAIGVDISKRMIDQAQKIDPEGVYRLIDDADLSSFNDGSFDLAQSIFTFDNIPTLEKKLNNLVSIKRALKPDGRFINLVSSPEIYLHEWASFSTRDFPENRNAKSGDRVRIVMKDISDKRPVEDIVWSDEAYRENYLQTGFEIIEIHKPLGKKDEPYEWITETEIAPWVIYVLKPNNPE